MFKLILNKELRTFWFSFRVERAKISILIHIRFWEYIHIMFQLKNIHIWEIIP